MFTIIYVICLDIGQSICSYHDDPVGQQFCFLKQTSIQERSFSEFATLYIVVIVGLEFCFL